MDPDAVLARYRAAVAAGDKIEAHHALSDLRAWKRQGGFPPRDGWPREV